MKMDTTEFVRKAKIGQSIFVCGQKYVILEHVKWHMLRSGQSYNKYTLKDNKGDEAYRFAEDPDSGGYLLVRLFELKEQGPFLASYTVNGNKFAFIAGEFCVAEEVEGVGHYKKGDLDIWWDYETGTGEYMSLGCNAQGKRADLIGKRVKPEDVEIVQ